MALWIVIGAILAAAAAVAVYFRINSAYVLLKVILSVKDNKKALVSLFQVDEDSRKHGGELVGDVLKAHGVEFVFTLCGGHISPILVACEARNIRVVDTRHEVTAVFAADAVARLTGGIGVAAVTAGPGITNTVTAIKNAQMAESPVLLLGGSAATLLKGRGALQDIDQMVLLKPLCKFCATIRTVKEIVPVLRQAIHAAQSGTPGPVFVEFPIDTLYPYQVVKRELGQKENPRGLRQRFVNLYLEYSICKLFGNAWAVQDLKPIAPSIPTPPPEKVTTAVDLILNAKKPLILFGSQAVLPPVKPDDLRRTVDEMGIPCFLGGMTRGLLGRNNKLHIRQHRKEALRDADLVILAGSVCDFRLSYGRVFSRQSKVVAINRNADQLYKNSDMFWKPSVALLADVGLTLTALAAGLKSANYKVAEDWLQTLRDRNDEKEAKNREMAKTPTELHLNPLWFLHELEEAMPDNAIIVADGGDFVGSAAYILRPRGPLQWLDPGAFGTLGVGGGFALGAKLVHPERPVWIIYGDGSVGYSITEFDTYVRHKLPVVAIVGNDACWSQIAREQVPMLGSIVGCNLSYTDYDVVAEGFGAVGRKLQRDDGSKLRESLQQIADLNEKGKPVLVNVMIGKTNFREGSISV